MVGALGWAYIRTVWVPETPSVTRPCPGSGLPSRMSDLSRGDVPEQDLTEEPDVVVPTETVFLDLDGDGVVDAVQTTRTVGFDVSGDGLVDVVEVTEELASGIGVDGTPSAIALTDTVESDFEHDGEADIEAITVAPDPAER